MKKIYFLLLATIFAHSLHAEEQGIIINEVMPANVSYMLDATYNYNGWVELYNPTGEEFNLAGYSFTDDYSQPQKFVLPKKIGSIKAWEYKIIYFGNNDLDANNANFKLDCDGATLYLFSANKKLLDSVEYGYAYPETSYARKTDNGSTWATCINPSPGKTNNNGEFSINRLKKPKANVAPGIYSGALTIKIEAGDGTIKYTTNGSEPTARSKVWKGAKTIDTTTVIRARAFKNGCIPSEILTCTYIIEDRSFDLPVVSIVTDPKNLWNDTIGIYCEGTNGVSGNGVSHAVNWNRDWRRPCNVEIFNNPHDEYIAQQCDLSIGGGYSRAYPEKSLELNAEKKYEGKNSFDVQLFAQKPHYRFKSLNIRNSGNDFYGSMFRDAMQQTLYSNYVDVDYLAYQPAIHYINGEYYGILNIRERSNHHHVYSNWGYEKEELDFIYTPDNKVLGTKATLEELVQLVTAGNHSQAQFEKIRTLIDIDEYINYIIIQSFSANTDWMSNNVKFYRYKNDGRFRWILFDLDHGFSNLYYNQFTATDRSGLSNKNAYTGKLFQGFKDNPYFREKFIAHATALIGGIMRPERCNAIIDSIASLITAEAPYHGKRWGRNYDIKAHAGMYKTFAENRQKVYSEQLASYFSLGEPKKMRIEPNVKTAIYINGVEVPTGIFSGYMHKGENYTLSVDVPYGYKFMYWTITATNNVDRSTESRNDINRKPNYNSTTIKFVPENASYKLVPRFEKIDSLHGHPVPAVRINELGANKEITYNDYFDKSDWVELYNRTDTAFNIAGLYISNSEENPRLYRLPDNAPEKTTIAPHGFCILWADEEPDKRQLHLPFKLPSSGGKIILSAYSEQDSTLLWRDELVYTPHADDESFGRQPDGSDRLHLLHRPSPATTNLYSSFNIFQTIDTVTGYQIDEIKTSIKRIEEGSSEVVEVKYYSLAGLFVGNSLEELTTGIYVRHTTFSNNNVKVEKIFVE